MAVCWDGGEMLLHGSTSSSAQEAAGRRLCSLGKVPGSVWGWEMLSPLWGLFTSRVWAGGGSSGTAKSLKLYTNGSGLLMDVGPHHPLQGHRYCLLRFPCPGCHPALSLLHPCRSPACGCLSAQAVLVVSWGWSVPGGVMPPQ